MDVRPFFIQQNISKNRGFASLSTRFDPAGCYVKDFLSWWVLNPKSRTTRASKSRLTLGGSRILHSSPKVENSRGAGMNFTWPTRADDKLISNHEAICKRMDGDREGKSADEVREEKTSWCLEEDGNCL